MADKIKLVAKKEINAIYYALIKTGYEFAEIDKSDEALEIIKSVGSSSLENSIDKFFR